MRIGIIAALPGELKKTVTRWERLPSGKSGVSMWRTQFGEIEVFAACAGMGSAAALRAFTAIEHYGAPDLVLSIGWAGALRPDLIAGTAYIPSLVVDSQTGERFGVGDTDRVLVTTPRVAHEADKHRLAASYRAMLVDMEAATVFRLAHMRDIPAIAMKAVSDELGARLPDFNAFTDQHGQMRMAAFVGFAVTHPEHWGPLMRLGRASQRGASTLASMISTFLSGISSGQLTVERVMKTGNVEW